MIALLLFALWPVSQVEVAGHTGQIELRMEMRQGTRWQRVDAHTVFRDKDEIRFIFRTSFPGYLRVLNQSSDGQSASLFPLMDSKKMGDVQADTDYVIPASKGSFVIGGKPGFDLTRWFVSPVPLEADWQPPTTSPEPNTLLPKCSEELRGRRTCLDSHAGPDAPLLSRDLSFGSRELSTLITVPDTSRKLVVYEFRVAHR